jgi:hypothetical protein
MAVRESIPHGAPRFFPMLAFVGFVVVPAFAQEPFYEVASIKPNRTGGRST